MTIAITMTATTTFVASRSGSGVLPRLLRLIFMKSVPSRDAERTGAPKAPLAVTEVRRARRKGCQELMLGLPI